MNPKPLLIVSTGQTLAHLRRALGDFNDWIAAGLQGAAHPLALQHWDARSASVPPALDSLAGVVLTGSHDMVTDAAPWSEQLAAWLRQCVQAQLPVLGICYGHQLLAHAMGGRVGNHPQGQEVGTHAVQLHAAAHSDALFAGLPLGFDAQLVHTQSVLQLPAQAQCLAHNAHEAHQAFRVGACAWGVQFHPEFSAQAMRGYIDALAPELARAGRQPHVLRAAVRDTPTAATLLVRFAALVAQRGGAVCAPGQGGHEHQLHEKSPSGTGA